MAETQDDLAGVLANTFLVLAPASPMGVAAEHVHTDSVAQPDSDHESDSDYDSAHRCGCADADDDLEDDSDSMHRQLIRINSRLQAAVRADDMDLARHLQMEKEEMIAAEKISLMNFWHCSS